MRAQRAWDEERCVGIGLGKTLNRTRRMLLVLVPGMVPGMHYSCKLNKLPKSGVGGSSHSSPSTPPSVVVARSARRTASDARGSHPAGGHHAPTLHTMRCRSVVQHVSAQAAARGVPA